MSYVKHNGINIYYEIEGEGPPLVLHHGMTETVKRWRLSGCVAALRPHYQLILLDARGHGASDKPHDPDAYSLEARTNDVIAVLDDLDIEKAHYFGHSLGGWIGFGLGVYAPARVSSLIIGGAQPYGQSFEQFRQILDQGLDAWVAVVEKMSGPFSPDERTEVYVNDLQALRASIAYDRPDIRTHLPALTMPSLLFAGEADPLHPLVERCAGEIGGARFVTLPGCNHFEVARQPELVLPHLFSFLGELAPVAELFGI
jgi:pimeloyl-ACP methyl ester carboxylesterase